MRPELDATAIRGIQEAMATRLGVAATTLTGDGARIVPRDGIGAVVTVELLDALVTIAPTELVPKISDLPRAALSDLDAVGAALADDGARPIGTAWLCFGTTAHAFGTADLPPAPGHATRPATSAELAAVRDACTPAEREESAVADAAEHFVAVDPAGSAVGIAGYARLPGGLAHLGVLVHPRHRGGGYGRAVATTAIRAAYAHGLIAQWRHRVGNDASAALATRAGLVRLGRETAWSIPDRAAG